MIGALGGTFDPPHYGHLALADAAVKELGLDKIIFIPAHIPPHKNHKIISSKNDRLAMLRLAIDGHPGFEISELEFERKGPSYSIDTLSRLKKTFPGDEIYFLLGADNVKEMEGWHRPEQIFDIAIVAAASRPGYVPAGKFASLVRYFDMTPVDISSTMIRENIKSGKPITGLLPPSVEAYIIEKGLYRNDG